MLHRETLAISSCNTLFLVLVFAMNPELKTPVILIGAGAIGTQWDTPHCEGCLTHAHAITLHPSLSLEALVDTSLEACQEAAHRWGVPIERCFTGWQACWEACSFLKHSPSGRPPWLVIATPDETHVSLLKTCLPCLPKGSVCIVEKPLGCRADETQACFALAQAHGVTLWVNYSRMFYPKHLDLIHTYQPLLGRPLAWHITYQRGFWHNATHALHTFLLWSQDHLAQPLELQKTSQHRVSDAFWEKTCTHTDPTYTGAWQIALQDMQWCQLQLLGLSSVLQSPGLPHQPTYLRSTFGMRGYFEKGELDYDTQGLHVRLQVLPQKEVHQQGGITHKTPYTSDLKVFLPLAPPHLYPLDTLQALPELYQQAWIHYCHTQDGDTLGERWLPEHDAQAGHHRMQQSVCATMALAEKMLAP
jgi:hypothetical protein